MEFLNLLIVPMFWFIWKLDRRQTRMEENQKWICKILKGKIEIV